MNTMTIVFINFMIDDDDVFCVSSFKSYT